MAPHFIHQHHTLLAGLVLSTVPVVASAQQLTELPASARVWVVERGAPRSGPLWIMAPGGRGAAGQVVRVVAETLYVAGNAAQGTAVRAIPHSALEAVLVSTGQASRAARVLTGVGFGAVFFGGSAAASGAITGDVQRGHVVTMSGIGAAIGAFFGATTRLDRWRRVRL